MLTGIGGGMLRDVLVSDVPAVLHSELYAVAALAGALVVVAGHALKAQPVASAMVGVSVLGDPRRGVMARLATSHRGRK